MCRQECAWAGTHFLDGNEPFPQRYQGVIEDGAGRHRHLMTATGTLANATPLENVSLVVLTARAFEAVWPAAAAGQLVDAGDFGAVFVHPPHETNIVLLHCLSSLDINQICSFVV